MTLPLHLFTGPRPLRAARPLERARRAVRAPVVRLCCGAVLLAGVAAPLAQAAEGPDWSLTAAVARHDNVRKAGVLAGWTRAEPLWQGRAWRLRLRHELELAAWRVPRASNLLELGYSPVLRLEHPGGGGGVFFVEGSIGVRLLSGTRVSQTRGLSTAFQFSDVLGAGLQWGPQGRSTLGLRYQHISNADIKRPNPGMDFIQLYYSHRF